MLVASFLTKINQEQQQWVTGKAIESKIEQQCQHLLG